MGVIAFLTFTYSTVKHSTIQHSTTLWLAALRPAAPLRAALPYMYVAQSKHNQPKVNDLEEIPHHLDTTICQVLTAENLTPRLLKPDAYIYTYLLTIV